MKGKARFVIVGSGWRASYYLRIAKNLPDFFEVAAVLCRRAEKAEALSKEWGIYATSSVSECIDMKPDFVVVAVSKNSGNQVALEWLDRGFFVLAETPAALNLEAIEKLKKLSPEKKSRLIVAEQYRLYPENTAIIRLLESDLLGPVSALNISLAHEYHAASLMRALMKIPAGMKFFVRAKSYEFPTVETLSRYESFKDGRIANKKRTVASFEFQNGKVAFYDFDSEQYRSPIRKNSLKIQGLRGEIIDRKVYYLDEKNEGKESEIVIERRKVHRKTENPNFKEFDEIKKITFEEKNLYEAPFGLCGLSQDETAIALLMQKTYDYSLARDFCKHPYPLEEAIQDAYMAIMMQSGQL